MEVRTTQALLATVEEGWKPFRGAVIALSPAQLERTIAAGWTAKEMLAHVAFWEETVLGLLPSMVGREAPALADWYGGEGLDLSAAWPDVDVHNAREAAWARGASVERVLTRLDTAHARVSALLATLTDAQAADQEVWQKVENETFGHYREHAVELEQAKG